MRDLREYWTYEDLLHGNAVLDMHESIDIARDTLEARELKEKNGK